MPASKRGSAVPDLGHSARDLTDLLARSFRQALVRAAGAAGYYPAVESLVQGDQLVIRADLPGLDPAHVETSVRGNRLTIKAQRRRKRAENGRKARYLHREIAYGTFRRQLRLPEGVKKEGITATYTNGVLEITVPVAGAPRQPIPVRGEATTHPVKVRGTRKARVTAA